MHTLAYRGGGMGDLSILLFLDTYWRKWEGR